MRAVVIAPIAMCLGELAALPDALLATLQINIALGILYWALKDSRYRDELFDRIVEAIEELKAPAKKADDEELHASLLKINRKFTVDHTVSMILARRRTRKRASQLAIVGTKTAGTKRVVSSSQP